MFRLTLDRRLARKATKPDDVFDLGAGSRNCIDCAARSGPKEEIGYCCATFVDAVTGAHLPAFAMRTDEAVCGESAVGFLPEVELKSVAAPFDIPHDYETGMPVSHIDNPLYIDPPISDDPIVAATGEERSCTWCAHSFMSYFESHTVDTYCARAVCEKTGIPLTVNDSRGSEQLCGAAGNWFEEAPPMTDEEAERLAVGGSTFYHW